MPHVRGVILDLDGTLIDSNDAHAHAWLEAMAEQGFQPPYETVRKLIGMGGPFLIPRAVDIEADSTKGKAISARRKEIFRERYLPGLKPFPKVRDLILRLKALGVKVVVASASKKEEVEGMLEIVGISEDIDGFTSASEVEDPKPEPDVVESALAKLSLPPGEVILLGDTPYDIESAAKAGVRVVALRSGGWSAEDLKGAEAVYWDTADLFTHLEGSPLLPSS